MKTITVMRDGRPATQEELQAAVEGWPLPSVPSKPLLSVPSNTIVTCANCGNEYELCYTEPFDQAGDGRRICVDCCEGIGPDDLPPGMKGVNEVNERNDDRLQRFVVCSGVGGDGCNPNCKHAKPHEPFCESDDVDPCTHFAGCGCIGEDVVCTHNDMLTVSGGREATT